jgi:hypothetical protein
MPEKRKDWTKVDVKTIKENWSKILPFSLIILFIILPLIFIGYITWSNMQNTHAPDANSGITTDTRTYGVHTENKTSEADKTGAVSDKDFSNTTDLLKFYIAWTKMEKANKSMMSGSSPTESQKQMIRERIDVETLRIDDLISSLEKLKDKLKTEAEKMEEYYEMKVSESTAKKL